MNLDHLWITFSMNMETDLSPLTRDSGNPVLSSLLVWCLIGVLAMLAIVALKAPEPVAATASPTEFSAERALAHVRAIAITPHPIGSDAINAAREYLVSQLSTLGLNPQIFQAIGISRGARRIVAGNIHDVIGRLPGTASSGAILLIAHYDSVYRGPGAADDAAGVASILETVRALRAGPAMKNDVIVLFTEGEEAGLLGAEAFAASHPWMKDAGLLLNFEARGNRGPSLLFETSPNNRMLIEMVAKAAPHPTGSSLFYALYKLLPNDTDFTVFRRSGIPGLNFAFGENLEAYHSRFDTLEGLSTSSLQHHGSYALALTRHFGEMDLTQLKKRTGDDIFFDWFGSNLIVYRESWVLPGQIFATILITLLILMAARRSTIRTSRLFLAILSSFALALVIPVILALVGYVLLRLLGGNAIVSDSPANCWLMCGFALLGTGIASFVLVRLRGYFAVQELSFAGLITVDVLNWFIVVMLPAGSYLLFWPLLLTTIGLLIIEIIGKGAEPGAQSLAGVAGIVSALLLFAPVAYLIYVFLTFQWLTLAALGLLLSLFFLLSVPMTNTVVPQGGWKPVVGLLLIAAVGSLAYGAKQSHHSAQYPQEDTIVYSANADNHSAAWISYDRSLDSWTSQFIPNGTQQRHPMPDYLGGLNRPVLSGPATVLDIPPPIIDVKASSKEGGLRKIQMNVRSQRNANMIYLGFSDDLQPVSIKIDGKDVNPMPNSRGLNLSFVGVFPSGIDLEVTFKAPSKIGLWVMDQTYSLPNMPAHPRPQYLTVGEGSDETIVSRQYML